MWLLASDGQVYIFQKILSCWDFPAQESLRFTESDWTKRKSLAFSSPLGENTKQAQEDNSKLITCYNQGMQQNILNLNAEGMHHTKSGSTPGS